MTGKKATQHSLGNSDEPAIQAARRETTADKWREVKYRLESAAPDLLGKRKGRGGREAFHTSFIDCKGKKMSALPKLPTVIIRPRLSVRGAAMFIRLPALQQMRLLHDQKYPKQEPQVFKQPYYAPPIKGIKDFLERGGPGLIDARAQLQRIRTASRRMHCTRVLESFVQSDHAIRGLKPISSPRLYAYVHGLELRLSPDIVAKEGEEDRYIFFNASAKQFDPETARLTLEFAYWLLQENNVDVRPKQVEFIDLFGRAHYSGRNPRKTTLRDLDENARLIESMWQGIEP
jgi:hypothetical protein